MAQEAVEGGNGVDWCPVMARSRNCSIVIEEGVVKIPLGRSGLFTMVDLEDYPLVADRSWYAHKHGRTYYARAAGRRRCGETAWVRMHQLIMPRQDGLNIDHLNRNGLDNRRENLRLATQRENNGNRRASVVRVPVLRPGQTCGIKGVIRCSQQDRWRAQVNKDGKRFWSPWYYSPQEASNAYVQLVQQVYPEKTIEYVGTST